MAQRSAEEQRGAPLASREAGGQCHQRAGPGEPGYPEHHRRWPESAARPPDWRVDDAERAQRSQRNDAVAEPLAQQCLDRLVGEGNDKKGSDPEAHVFAAHAEVDFAGRVAGLSSRTAPSCKWTMDPSVMVALEVG